MNLLKSILTNSSGKPPQTPHSFWKINIARSLRRAGAPNTKNPSLRNAFAQGNRAMAHFGKPGLLISALGAGYAGAAFGGSDANSFTWGAIGGLATGYGLEKAAKWSYGSLGRYQRTNAAQLSKTAFQSIGAARILTSAKGRNMLFATGALLGGAYFGSLGYKKKDLRRGFNGNRGSHI